MDADRKQDKRTEPRNLDIASMVKDATDKAGHVSTDRFNERMHGAVQRALDAGQAVTLYSDGRASNIVGIDRGMLRDDKGQRWGSLALMTDPEGKLGNRLSIESLEREPRASPTHGTEVLRSRGVVPAALRTDEAGVRAAATEVARRATTGLEPPTNDNWTFQYKGHDLIAWQRRPGVVDVLNTRLEVLFPGRTTQELNAVSPEPARPKPLDIGTDAQLRDLAKSQVAANDRQADAKREVIEHMTADELKRFAAAGADKPKAEQILRDAAAREDRASATGQVRDPVPPLADRFNISRRLFAKEYEFRDQPGKIAFSERFNALRSEHNTPAAAIAMIDRAGERGWSSVRVTGSAEFKRQAWIAAEARGIKAIGYEPTKGDIEAARAERERLARETAWRGGSVERVKDPQEINSVSRGPDRTADRPADRTASTAHPALADREAQSPAAAPVKRDDDRQAQSQSTQPAEPRRDEPRAAEPAATAKRTDDARGAATPDIPSLAGAGAQRDEKTAVRNDKDRQDPAQRATANPDRGRDREREPELAVLRDVSSAAFMRALEQVMERDSVPTERRPEIRTVAERQFAALRAEGKTVRVPLIDREAPRRVPVQLPQYEVKRAAQERAR